MATVRTLRGVAVVLMATMAAGSGFARGTDSVEELVRAAERGDAQAQFDLGFLYATAISHFEVDDAEAVSWYRRAAEQGFAPAQSALGRAYAHSPVLEQDFTQAATWCRLGAEQGDADGQLCMASLYAGGCGVEQDYAESARWYRLAADRGSGVAQARLGDIYATGEGGVRQDAVEADKWYRRAVEPGTYRFRKVAGVERFSGRPSLFHLFVLARMYQDGIGVPRNDVAAYKWLDINNRMHGGTLREIDEIARRLTPEQVAEAQRAAVAFLETYRIDSYEFWRHWATIRSMPKEARQQRVLRALYPVARLGYPVARLWWRSSAAIRARISPPFLADALMTDGSSRAPACMTATTAMDT